MENKSTIVVRFKRPGRRDHGEVGRRRSRCIGEDAHRRQRQLDGDEAGCGVEIVLVRFIDDPERVNHFLGAHLPGGARVVRGEVSPDGP